MRKPLEEYINNFTQILNFSDMSWWIIDYKNDPDFFYCNELMVKSFNLNPSLTKHSVAQTCPIAGDYLKNVKLASSEKANLILKEYFELINRQRDEYNNVFPYYNEKSETIEYFLSRSRILELDEQGEVSILYGVIENITNKIIQQNEVKEYNEIIDKFVITSTSDKNAIIKEVSTAYCEISGYTKDELIGKNHSVLKHEDTPHELFSDLWRTITSGKKWEGEIKNKKKDGSAFWIKTVIFPRFDDFDNIKYYTTISQDITDKKIIENLSNRDKLTNVYNRGKLDKLMEREIKYSKRYDTNLSIILLDIDFFKHINDQFGHLEGDKVLIEFASILRKQIRQTDYVGRWGGEEFLIICPSSTPSQAKILAEKLKERIEEHDFTIKTKVSASFGISTFKINDTIDNLLNRADKALYEAKNSGRNKVIIFEDK